MIINAYIGLGSNLQNPPSQLRQAIITIQKTALLNLQGVSNLYASTPLYFDHPEKKAPIYYNAVIKISTEIKPFDLLDILQTIELKQGRERKEKWGSRTLDLDLLLYGNQCINTSKLQIPHSQMHLRNFVLLPLLDLSPDLQIPNGKKIIDLHQRQYKKDILKVFNSSYKKWDTLNSQLNHIKFN